MNAQAIGSSRWSCLRFPLRNRTAAAVGKDHVRDTRCGITIRHREVERRQFRFLGKGINQFPASAQTEPVTESKTDFDCPTAAVDDGRTGIDRSDDRSAPRPPAPTSSTTVAGWSCQERVPRAATPMGDSASEHATESKVCDIDDEWSDDSSR
jgi:hypothetical protein